MSVVMITAIIILIIDISQCFFYLKMENSIMELLTYKMEKYLLENEKQ